MNSQSKIFILFSFFVLFIITGCENNPSEPDFQNEITVFGYLYGNEALGPERAISIFNTRPVTSYYDPYEAAVKDADVTITLKSDGSVTKLIPVSNKPGYYYNDSLHIIPKETYLLTVKTGDRIVTASTTVPAELESESQLSTNSINYEYNTNLGYEKPVFLEHENADQIIMVEMYCNEPYNNAEYVNPFNGHNYPDDEEEYEGSGSGEPRRIYALVPFKDLVSGLYNNRNTIYWYSSMIVFYGSNTLHIMAIDDNMHHFLTKENPELSGGVNGGIGVFGSLCGIQYQLYIKK
ncbi:hypothetical protein JXQ31_07235 [candidate division KSB1 bacterium]|nr:hypothetical protein [candidate division KSB1 bacterium]